MTFLKTKSACLIASIALCTFFIATISCAGEAWIWQNPLPEGNYIEDIQVFQNNHIIAVGNAGMIYLFNGSKWNKLDSGVTSDLEAIWGATSDNFYVAGSEGTILKLHNNQWVTLQNTGTDDFTDIWGVHNQICAVGKNVTMLDENNNTWGATIEKSQLNNTELNAIYGHSKNDIFVVGDQGTIFHYNGNQWKKSNSPTEKNLQAIWGNGLSEYYCAGEDGIVLHYRNFEWSVIETNLSVHFYDIKGHDSDIWITGGLWQNSGIVLKYNGTSFSSPVVLNNIPFSSICMSNTDDIYVAGSKIYYFNNGNWSGDALFRTGDVQSIRDIWGISASDIFTAGDNGSVLFFNGYEWKRIQTPVSDHLNAIWGTAENNIYAVGANGIMIHYNGIAWTVINKMTTNDLNDLWATTDNQFFAVGSNGTFLHFQNNNWEFIDTNIAISLNAIWGFSDDNLYIAGDNAAIFHYNGQELTEIQTSFSEDLQAIWGRRPDDIYAVGKKGLILNYNGMIWKEYQHTTDVLLNAVWGTDQDTFAAGEYGTILHKNGNTWEKMVSGTTNWLAAGWAINDYDCLAAGFGGSILKYSRQRLQIQAPHYVYTSDNSIPITISVYPHTASQDLMISLSSDSSYIQYTSSAAIAASLHSLTMEIPFNHSNIKGHKHIRITANSDDTNSVSTDIWLLDTESFNIMSLTSTCINGWDDSSIYAMGNNGTIHSVQNDTVQRVSFYRDIDFEDIWFASRNVAYAVGKSGIILHFNGFDWKIMRIDPENNNLFGIWGTAKNNVFAVGENGIILHYDGNQWEQMESDTRYTLHAIWGTSADNIYAAGESGTLLHFDGSQWTSYMENTFFDLYDIWGISQNEIYVVGSDGMVFFFDGQNWQKIDIHVTTDLYSIWGSCKNDVFIVGENGVIQYFDGNIWFPLFQEKVKDTQIFHDVWGMNGKDVYISGNKNLIHYCPDGIKLSPIHSHYVGEGLSLSIPFQLTANNFQQVFLSGSSSNEQLVPDDSSHISFQGTDNNRWMVIKPVQGQTGETIISISASESDNFPCMTSFKVTVLSSREILMRLFNATDGDNWYNNQNWKSYPTDNFSQPGTECEWHGVTCDESENIIALSLESNALKGSIPGEISGLSHLETINLSYNHLEGEIPHEIVTLKNLRKLNLSSNMFNGHLPKYLYMLDSLKNQLSDFRWNALISKYKVVNNFLDLKQTGGNWLATQTLPPSNFSVSLLDGKFLFNWNVIDYCQNDGGYELIYAVPEYTHYFNPLSTIDDKSSQQTVIDQLQTNNRYQFGIRTFTKNHNNNPNTIYSSYSYTNTEQSYSPPNIHLSAPAYAQEGHASPRCSVKLSRPQTIDLIIHLISDDRSVQPIPLTTTIYAGKTEAFFYLNIQNDLQYIPEKKVMVQAYAMGQTLDPVEVIIKDQETPYWKTKNSPSFNHLNAVWGTSQSNVIAVGNYGTAIHYDGQIWSLMKTGTTDNLYDVWGNSKNNYYAVGSSGTILHYDGFGWQRMPSSISVDLLAIDGLSSDSIYAGGVGQDIFHFDGFQWEKAVMNHDLGYLSGNTLSDMWTYTENALIGVGYSGKNLFENDPVMLQMANNEIKITASNQTSLPNEKHTAIWGISEDNYFVSGYAESSFQYTGIVYQTGIEKTYNLNARIMDLWGTTNNEVYAVGDVGSIFLFNGKQWLKETSGTESTLNGIWGLRDSIIIAVGDQGTILHFESDKPNNFVDDSLDIPAGTIRDEYVMASVCVNFKEKQSTQVFSNILDENEYAKGENFKIGTYDPIRGDYIQFGKQLLIEPGRAYWFLFREETFISVEGETISCVLNFDLPLQFNSDTDDGWNMIACPNKMDYEWSKLKVFAKNSSGEIVDNKGKYLNEAEIPFIFELSDDNPYIYKHIYKWVGGEKHYASYKEMTMIKNQGYWVEAKMNNVYLRFSRSAQVTNNLKRTARRASRSSESTKIPPMPMGTFSESNQNTSSQHVSDSFCFIKTCLF
jgi:hypothetical protein